MARLHTSIHGVTLLVCYPYVHGLSTAPMLQLARLLAMMPYGTQSARIKSYVPYKANSRVSPASNQLRLEVWLMRLKSVSSPHATGGCTVGRPFEEVETVKPSVRYAEPTCPHVVWSFSALSVYFFPLALANTMGLLRRGVEVIQILAADWW